AFNPVDFYIYGLRGPAPAKLIRIGSDGSVVDLGDIPSLAGVPVLGEIGPGGMFYTFLNGRLHRINLATMAATSVPLSTPLAVQDLTWHDGMLYTATANMGRLYRIDPASGAVTDLGPTGITGAFGGMFGASNGVFGANNGGGFYQFDLATGAATLISDLPGSSNNDGAKCPTTPLSFPA